MVACREGFIDTPDYIYMYKQIGPRIENVFNETVPRVEKGYLLITALLNMISTDPQILLITFGTITIFFFSLVIVRYSEKMSFSLILFVCNLWISCMNGLRQIFVASIISFLGALLISAKTTKRKIILFVALALLLSTIHTSILLVIPFYFMAKGKFLNKWVVAGYLFGLLLLMFPPLYEFAFKTFTSGTSYANMIDSESTMGALRLLISAAPVVLCLIYRFSQKNAEIADTDAWMMNLMLFGFLFSLLSLKMVYFARMRMYFNIFSTITLPYVVNRLFSKKYRNVMIWIINFLYIAVFIYQLGAYGDEVTNFRLFFEV
ncbi:MAG: EpsG family protein [Clostridia bacterium]|nr:EpsG family protein [Clostridia bacterium]